jgi:hypothetical protein
VRGVRQRKFQSTYVDRVQEKENDGEIEMWKRRERKDVLDGRRRKKILNGDRREIRWIKKIYNRKERIEK